MPDEGNTIKIRVRSGESEAEVEAPPASIHEAIELIPTMLAKLPQVGVDHSAHPIGRMGDAESPRPQVRQPVADPAAPLPSAMPTVSIEKGDSLSDVISRFFGDPWGRSPRKLMEVREALQSYGLNYPKQSVAVALLRLAKASKIRRFKGEGGEYVYTVSTGAVRTPVPMQPSGVQHSAEAAPQAMEGGEEPEEQLNLNLDAPSTN